MYSTHSDSIGNFLIVVSSNLRRIDHVFANQLNSSVTNCWGAIKKMTLDCVANVGLEGDELASVYQL